MSSTGTPAPFPAYVNITPSVFTAGDAPSDVPNYSVVAYEVRTGGTGSTVCRVVDADAAGELRDQWASAGFRVYVALVEAVDGEWVALED